MGDFFLQLKREIKKKRGSKKKKGKLGRGQPWWQLWFYFYFFSQKVMRARKKQTCVIFSTILGVYLKNKKSHVTALAVYPKFTY
jgi:hypothetical protein